MCVILLCTCALGLAQKKRSNLVPNTRFATRRAIELREKQFPTNNNNDNNKKNASRERERVLLARSVSQLAIYFVQREFIYPLSTVASKADLSLITENGV